METREDLKSILGFLPVVFRSSTLFWPPPVVEALKALSRGPDSSNVGSGELLFLAISDIRNSLNLGAELLSFSAAKGYAIFFDDLMSRAEAAKWFGEVMPELAKLMLRLPSLLETHYQNTEKNGALIGNGYGGREILQTGLRLLESQEPGLILLSQELISALLACSFFCLFPTTNRGAKDLPAINFNHLFESMYESYSEKQENKIKCIIHYFGKICSCMPVGNVSFERKVLLLDPRTFYISYPKANFWSESITSLCSFEVHSSGLIEDQSGDALEVDFANKYLGGGALNRGCVQEEIRFMINPELIAGMLFLPSMADNEAIEIVGAERFSNYTGYASSFRFCGDYVDTRDADFIGRRKTRIVAIDALINPGMRQFGCECLLREINKAFCGFYDQCKYHQYQNLFSHDGFQQDQDNDFPNSVSMSNHMFDEPPSTSSRANKDSSRDELIGNCEVKGNQYWDHQDETGIVTGNWGCGAFGGDPELKAMIQWLAASQALRPYILYYTFDMGALQMLNQVTLWILSHRWCVGDLWNMLLEYSSQRIKGETKAGFFDWLLPSLSAPDPMILDAP